MEAVTYMIVFVFGAIIGSFLNVVIYRLHTGKSTRGRSHCLSCGRPLVWFELMPILSYALLRGYCRTCHAHIPIRYLFVEILTGGLFVFAWYMFLGDVFVLVLHFILLSLLVVVLLYDMRHTIIPDEAVWGLTLSALALALYSSNAQGLWLPVFFHIGAGLLASAFFASLWYISRGRWMGLGDAKLALPLGILTGPTGALGMIVLSFWIGAAIMLPLMAVQWFLHTGTTRLRYFKTPLRMKSEVPFAPFLIIAFFVVYFFHVDVLTIIAALTSA